LRETVAAPRIKERRESRSKKNGRISAFHRIYYKKAAEKNKCWPKETKGR